MSSAERQSDFALALASLVAHRSGKEGEAARAVELGCDSAELRAFAEERAAAAETGDELLALARVVCFWDASAMPWCLHAMSSCAQGSDGVKKWQAVSAGVEGAWKGGSVVGEEALEGASPAPRECAGIWELLLRRCLALRLLPCALLLRCGPARYAFTEDQEAALLEAVGSVSAAAAAHFVLLSPYASGVPNLDREERGCQRDVPLRGTLPLHVRLVDADSATQ